MFIKFSAITFVLSNFVGNNNARKSVHTMILAIGRAERFSPNSVEKDAAILESVVSVLRKHGHVVKKVSEMALGQCRNAVAYLSMGRLPETLRLLAVRRAVGALVVNSPSAVELCCNRKLLTDVLRRGGIPVAPDSGNDGYWLKRATGVAETKYDVQYVPRKSDVPAALEMMKNRGIDDVLVCAHVAGDLLKFYGVRGSGFFRYYYPGDDGHSKFGDERRNGSPHHYAFDAAALYSIAEQAADIAGTDVYGGDCIVESDGSICVIDFNDWPSFSRCRDEAAEAIAQLFMVRLDRMKLK